MATLNIQDTYVYGNMLAFMGEDNTVSFYCDMTSQMVRNKDKELVTVDSRYHNTFEDSTFVLEIQMAMDVIKNLRRSWENN